MEITNPKRLAVLFLLAAATLPSAAQFKLSGEFRPRTEYSHGYSTLASDNQKASLFTSQRTRLNAEFKATGIQTKLVLQDVRLWGSQPQSVGNQDFAVSVHEAWAEAQFGKSLALRLGRQEVGYDNQRLFGMVGWAQQGRSHDLALLRYTGFIEAHLGVAYHESGNRKNNIYTGPDAYKFLQYLWLSKSFGRMKVSLLGINNGVPSNTVNENGDILSQKIRYTTTFGPYLEFRPGRFAFQGNFYYQTGDLVNGKTLSAYEYLIEGQWSATNSLSLGAGYEELSGTGFSDDPATSHSFITLYGTGHKFNGHMDYFYVNNHAGSVGLRDLYARIGYKLKSMSLGLDVHHFRAQAEMAGSQGAELGTEFDFYAGYKVNEWIEMNVGYSHLLPTESLKYLKGGSTDATQNWAWIQFAFKPAFIK